MGNLLPEIRLAIRRSIRYRGFATTVVLTLGLGIAATTVVFSLVYGGLLRPPPFAESDRLMILYRTASESGHGPVSYRWSNQRLDLLRRETRAFERVGSFSRNDVSLMAGDEPEQVRAEVVSADYFATLGLGAALGRTFLPAEDSTPGTHPVLVLSHGLWTRRFGSDPAVVGRTVRVNGRSLAIVGVLPAGFEGLTGAVDLWIPRMMAPALTYIDYLTTEQNFISGVGRRAPGVSSDQARAELAVLGSRIAAALPDQDEVPTSWSATAAPLSEARVDRAARRSLLLLFGAVGFLLLLACVNVAGLALAHGTNRRQEVAVRLAVGASRGRLIRQFLIETAVLGAAGGVVGAGLAALVIRMVHAPGSAPGPTNMYGALGSFAAPRLDPAVLGFTLLASVVAIVLAGLVPALQAGSTDLGAELKDRTSSTGSSPRALKRTQATLVVAELALAVLLSVGAALLFTSLRRLTIRPLGIDPGQVLTFRVQPSEVRYQVDQAAAVIDRVLEAVSAVPGVVSATVDACAPLGLTCANTTLYLVGRPEPPPDQAPAIMRHYVGADHFRTLGIPLLRGRAFGPDDRADRPGVVIVNQTAARRFWPNADPIGQRVWFGGGSRWESADSSAEIVGVVGDVPYGALEGDQVPSFYTPYRQFTYASRMVMVRVNGDPMSLAPAIRRAVRGVDELPIFEVRALTDRLGDSWARTRFNAVLLGVFAMLALILAAGGVYGLVAHSVSQRTRELGIRAALGADRAGLLRLVVGEGMVLAGLGVGIGLILAVALGRAVRSFLFEVSPADPVILGLQAVLLLGTAVLASYLPARRAARVDPVRALRAE